MSGSVPDRCEIIQGDAFTVLQTLPFESVHCVVTSPPYWGLRDYGTPGQLGLEPTPQEHVAAMVEVFREVRRVLRSDGTLWLNEGDCYNNTNGFGRTVGEWKREGRSGGSGDKSGFKHDVLKTKDLVGMPWRVAFALQEDGWWLRSDIIWSKPNPMPESVTDRPTKAHEYLFLLAKSERYYYDADAIREGREASSASLARYAYGKSNGVKYLAPTDGSKTDFCSGKGKEWPSDRNKRTVWTIPTAPYPDAHFATFPPDLVRPCILAGCPVGGTVLDPFMGSGTTLAVALEYGRRGIGIELNAEYVKLAERRIAPHAAQEILL